MLERLEAAPIVAVLRAPSAQTAIRAVDALVAGGVTTIEVTYSTPNVAEVISEVARRYGSVVYLGAGTITDTAQAVEAAEAGAEFLVSPGSVPRIAKAMIGTGCLTMLGALTPTEVMLAQELGADVIKIFPASLGGPGYLRSLRAPFPDGVFMPTGGVNAGNVAEWLSAGAIAVGAGGELVSAAAMASSNWVSITEAARSFVAALP